MDRPDAQHVALLARKIGLVTGDQLEEAWKEMGTRGGEAESLLLILERKGTITPWHSAKLMKMDMDGYFLGGYRILYKIASGSFGRVFRAEDPQSGRVVAIKVLRRRWTENAHHVELFEREGRVGLSLQHPNIVEILTVNKDVASGQYYIVMEFVEGGNLREILSIRKKLEPAEALRIAEDAASGLSYAYSRGVTHRDMKLTNILISTTGGTAKVVDFGLANLYSSFARSGRDEDEKVDRTVDYAGLEKTTGVKTGDVRSDIYFLGCVLYEILTGRPPLLPTRNAAARMHRQRYEGVTPMRADEVSGPLSLFRLVETMMALNPQQRYQTPSQLVDAIRAVRSELTGGKAMPGKVAVAKRHSVYVAEKDERLQNPIREKFRELGYKVFLAADPVRALEHYRKDPYDVLVVDAGTTGEDGLLVFDRVMAEAARLNAHCGGILILSDGQANWVGRVHPRANVCVLHRPVTLKQLSQKLQELVPPE